MHDGYNFNEQLRQFEPLDKTCVYCQKRKSISERTYRSLKLYKEKNRTNLIVIRSVKYDHFSIQIPRCSKCFSIHKKVKLYSRILTWLTFILTMPLGYLLFGGVAGMFVSLISSILLTVYVYTFSEKKFLELNQIESEFAGAENIKIVKDFLNDDWTPIKPSA